MAFSNVRRVDIGGGLAILAGNFTQVAGAGSQTLAIGAGAAGIICFDPKVSSEPVDCRAQLTSESISSAINTLTIYGNAAVSSGFFAILLNSGG